MLVKRTTHSFKKHMNLKTQILTVTTCLIAFAAPMPLHAGKGGKKVDDAEKAARPRMLLKKYDTDKDGAISSTEAETLRTAFDADKTGPLKKLDANNDGTLDDSEIAAIKARHGKGRGKAAAAKAERRKNRKNV